MQSLGGPRDYRNRPKRPFLAHELDSVNRGGCSVGNRPPTKIHQRARFTRLDRHAPKTAGFPVDQAYISSVDLKRDQLETRVATLELMLVTARARPKPREDEIAKLEQELKAATAALEKYNRDHPRN